MAEINNIIYKVEVDTASGKVNIDGITKGFEQADKSFNKLRKNVNKGLGGLDKSLQGTSKASGGATASVMELGRAISDAPYGIRGMANNLTQLVSQIGFTTKSAGGFTNAMKLMWKTMMGPLGIVLAITTAITAMDFFFGAQKKAKEETSKLNEVFGEETTKLMVLKRVMDDSNVSLEDKTELAKLAEEQFDDLNIVLDENGKLTEESAKQIDKLSIAFIKNAKARAIAQLIQEEMAAQAKVEARAAGESLNFFEKLYLGITAKIRGTSKAVNAGLRMDKKDRGEDMEDSLKNVDRYISMLSEKDAELAKELFKKTRNARKGKAKIIQTPEEFNTDALSLQSEVDAWDKKMLLAATKDKDQRLQLELIFYKKKQELRRQDRVESEFNELRKYEDKIDKLVKAGKMEAGAGEAAITLARMQTSEKVDGINGEHNRLIDKAEEVTKALRFGVDGEENEEVKAKLRERIKFALEAYMEVQQGVTNFMNGEFDRQLTIEQNKTNALNNELNKRLLNENLSKNERKRIQLEIGANDEILRKKQEKIERKRFKLNKAANIAQATISTYLSAQKAYQSQLALPTPDAPVRAKIAAGVAVASGLLQVAAIARTKFQSSAGSGGQIGGGFGGGSGGGNDRSFNFNLAGASRENQLAQTLQGRFDQPIQAYVVSRDITNSQQLDEDIRNNASFG